MTSDQDITLPPSAADLDATFDDTFAVAEPATVTTAVTAASEATAASEPRPSTKKRKPPLRKRKLVKRSIIWLHRWTSLVLGIVLLLITTTGAALVYSPEWTRWTNSGTFTISHTPTKVSVAQAIDIVNDAHKDFDAGGVNVYSGLYEIRSNDDDAQPGFWGVDPGTGKITGYANPNSGVMAFMEQIHECFFTCDDYPGYVPFLEKHVPTLGMHWLKDVTWAAFILGVFGIFLLFLGASGVWLWWPGVKKWSHGFRVRWKKGRYARDYDLHQVIGMAAVPFLLMWGLTGANFEFHWVSTAWYAVTGGEQPDPYEAFTSNEVKDPKTPDIGMAAAITSAQALAGNGKLVYASSPAADDATGTYDFYFSKDFDQYRFGAYPGQYGVSVGRHDAAHTKVTDLGKAKTLSNKLLDAWGAPMFHYGESVNGWWRIPWFLFGLTPILLAVTGVSTWLAKRSVKNRRKQAQQARAAAQATADAQATAADPGDEHTATDLVPTAGP